MESRAKQQISGAILLMGVLMGIVGVSLMSGSGDFFDFILKTNLALSPDSKSYPMWKNLPVPLKTSVKIFHVLNPKDVEMGFPAKLEERGPFVFWEYHEKTRVLWNLNSTVTYNQIRRWHFDAKLSNGSLDDAATILNAPAATMSALLAKESEAIQKAASVGFGILGEELFVTKTVRQILFEGYQDPLLNAGTILPIKLPGITKKFGYFYGRNNSDSFDGVFNIKTGKESMKDFGQVFRWNYAEHTPFFPDKCGEVRGAGDLFPPHLESSDYIELYSNDLCRPLRANLAQHGVKSFGITANKYVVDHSYFANSTENPDNYCYEGGNPHPSGVYNASSCRFSAPVFISNPHFYDADPIYGEAFVNGSFNPDKSKHESYFIVEPASGLPVTVKARFQVNLFIRRLQHVTMFEHVKNIMFPVVWFESSVEPTNELSTNIWILSNLKSLFVISGLVMLGIGISVVIIIIVYHKTSKKSVKHEEEGNLLEEPEEVPTSPRAVTPEDVQPESPRETRQDAPKSDEEKEPPKDIINEDSS